MGIENLIRQTAVIKICREKKDSKQRARERERQGERSEREKRPKPFRFEFCVVNSNAERGGGEWREG